MQDPTSSDSTQRPTPRDQRPGWAVTGLGVALIVWATLGLASAGYGSRPKLRFADRRSYNMVKRDVHRAFPLNVLRAAGGLVLVFVGARMRR